MDSLKYKNGNEIYVEGFKSDKKMSLLDSISTSYFSDLVDDKPLDDTELLYRIQAKNVQKLYVDASGTDYLYNNQKIDKTGVSFETDTIRFYIDNSNNSSDPLKYENGAKL